MRKALFTVWILALIVVWMGYPYAAENISDDARSQLVSQTTDILKDKDKMPATLDEKPVIAEDEKKAETTEEDNGPKFFVKKITLEGMTLFAPGFFDTYVQAFENKQTTFSALKSLCEIITNVYRSQGYTTSRAFLPPQEIENQTVKIQIIEGKVGEVLVQGNKYFSENSYKRSMRFGKNRYFRYQDLESSMYQLNRKADRRAKAYLIAGKSPETTDIILKVEDKNPIHMYYNFSNRGTKLTHRARHSVHFNHGNLLGFGDTFSSSLTMAEEGAVDAGGFSYAFPLEDNNLTLLLDGSYAKSMLTKHLKSSEIKSESVSVNPGVQYSFYQTPAMSLDGYAGFDFQNSRTTINDIQNSSDRMRVLKLGPRFTFQNRSGRTLLNSDFNFGIPGFLNGLEENDINASRPNSGGNFTSITLNAVRIQRLPSSMLLLSRVGGQWTAETLTSTEQYRLGGANSVRGYPESESSGDVGWNFSEEVYTSIPFVPKSLKIPYTKRKWSETVRLLGFLDGGKTYIRERAFETNVKDKFLLGIGFGVRVDFDETFSLQTDLGFPIGDESTDENSPQLHFSIKAGF